MTQQEIERSIIKKFKKEIWRKFTAALNDYHMISNGDRILVPVSADVRSVILAKEFSEIAKHGIQNFTHTVVILPNADRALLEMVGISCEQICDEGKLFSYAIENGCNKIAMTIDFDMVIETILDNVLTKGKVETILPMEETAGVTLIQPLYLTTVTDIRHFVKYNELPCEVIEDEQRAPIRALLQELTQENKYVPMNIFRSVENVNLATLVAYLKTDERTHFLDQYDELQGTAGGRENE